MITNLFPGNKGTITVFETLIVMDQTYIIAFD